jgi:23S rRNA (cytosine1962-C5)-methyltransferase
MGKGLKKRPKHRRCVLLLRPSAGNARRYIGFECCTTSHFFSKKNMDYATKIYLKPGKDEFVRRRHPWVFSGAIARVEGAAPADGDVVGVFDKKNNLLGAGHFHHGSIAVRLLSFGDDDLQSADFWRQRFEQAYAVRQTAGVITPATDAFRLVHGEGDGLSGLVVDVYAHAAVVQCHSIGMHRQRAHIAAAIRATLGERVQVVYDKSAESLPPKYAENQQNTPLWSATEAETETVVREHDVQFRVNWETGQKTGFFIDQRDNRRLLGELSAGRSVLNAFCYSGGFSCYALRAGASLVHSVDVSAKAMLFTDDNVALNGGTDRHTSYTADVLKFLREGEQMYDVVVIDPPAFAKSLDKRHNAVQGYKRLNELALRRVAAGGLMFTFSCSQVVDRALFYHTVAAAAMEVGRSVRVLHHLTQGADHPVSMFHPEGAYLKGLVLHVE